MSEQPDEYEIRARLHRINAGRLRLLAAHQDVYANVAVMTGAVQRLAAAMTAGDARDVAAHPDLAELNVQMDSFYGDHPVRPDEEPAP